METIYDSIVVGGGPAGLSAAINLVQRGKSVMVFNAGDNLLRRAEKVDNYLGLPSTTGAEMMDIFLGHAKDLGVEIRSGIVGNIFPAGKTFMVNCKGEIFSSRSIILASGVAKAPTVKGEDAFLGKGVSYCATCDGMLYRGKDVAVWGLSPDAPHEANFLADIGCTVTYISGKKPQGLNEKIAFISGKIDEVRGENSVTGITVGDMRLPVAGVFILRTSIAPASLLPGIETDDGYVKIDSRTCTNIEGVYAAGDITGKPLQISNAVGDGLVAALTCVEFLDKKENV